MPNYDLIVSDIDGTLVYGSVDVPEHILTAVRNTRRSGRVFTLASGRNRREMNWYFDKLGFIEPFIAMGGAYVEDPTKGCVIRYNTIETHCLSQILDIGRDLQLGITIEYPDVVFMEGTDQSSDEVNRLSSQVYHVPSGEFDRQEPPGKVILVGEDVQLMQAETALAGLEALVDHSRSRPHILDITGKDTNKGTALFALRDYLRIPLERVAVIGDGLNDLSLFEQAGFSIAMGNGAEALKARADLVAPEFENDGFIWALNALLSI